MTTTNIENAAEGLRSADGDTCNVHRNEPSEIKTDKSESDACGEQKKRRKRASKNRHSSVHSKITPEQLNVHIYIYIYIYIYMLLWRQNHLIF